MIVIPDGMRRPTVPPIRLKANHAIAQFQSRHRIVAVLRKSSHPTKINATAVLATVYRRAKIAGGRRGLNAYARRTRHWVAGQCAVDSPRHPCSARRGSLAFVAGRFRSSGESVIVSEALRPRRPRTVGSLARINREFRTTPTHKYARAPLFSLCRPRSWSPSSVDLPRIRSFHQLVRLLSAHFHPI